MKISIDTLAKYGASVQDLQTFENMFGTEASALEVFNSEIDLEFKHWLYHYYALEPEEIKFYLDMCGIDEESKHIFNSTNISFSSNISNSDTIEDSKFVYNCGNIMNSQHIYNALDVINSHDVTNSNNIKDSYKIVRSANVKHSSQIYKGNNIQWSKNLDECNDMEDCGYCYMSYNLIDCYFCGFVRNSTHCLFCDNINDSHYHIFNKEVSYQEFTEWREKLQFYLERENTHFVNTIKDEHSVKRVMVHPRFDAIFTDLSSDFYGFIGTMPNYDEELFLQLFFK